MPLYFYSHELKEVLNGLGCSDTFLRWSAGEINSKKSFAKEISHNSVEIPFLDSDACKVLIALDLLPGYYCGIENRSTMNGYFILKITKETSVRLSLFHFVKYVLNREIHLRSSSAFG